MKHTVKYGSNEHAFNVSCKEIDPQSPHYFLLYFYIGSKEICM